MSRINKLTKEQEAQLQPWAEKWIAIGLSTEPANWEIAEKAIHDLYRLSGLTKVPIIRVSSPIVGALAAPIAANIIHGKDARNSAVYSAVYSAVDSAVDSAVYSAVDSAVDSAVRSTVESAVYSAVESAVGSAVESAVDRAKIWWHSWIGGALWSYYPSWYSYITDILGVAQTEIGQVYRQIVQTAGYYWPNKSFCMLCDRPKEINRDASGRLHSDKGPSINWRDGWGLWHWHGVAVTRNIIEHPDKITLKQINAEENVEVRRVMLERYGMDRYVKESNMKEIHKDKFGILLQQYGGEEPLTVVHVINGTPELDGSYNEYFLSVPPTMKTAREAVAWTYGLEALDYNPKIRT